MSKWYDKGNLLSHKSILNFLIGPRGYGKTYAFKTWCIEDFIKHGKQFVWVRRYGTEIDLMRKSFFDDVITKYPNHKLTCTGNKKSGKFYCDGKLMGYYFALSTSSIAKSSSYPLVDKIIYDEFLIMGNVYHYLPDEVTLLIEFMETVFRNRDTDTSANVVKPRGVYMIGNNITQANVYFLYYNIPNKRPDIWTDKTRGITVEMSKNLQFINEKKNSRFGRLIQGTKYYEYNVENVSYVDNDKFIRDMPKEHMEYNCCIEYHNTIYGFWSDLKNGEMYCNKKYDPCMKRRRYSLTKDDHDINLYLVTNINNTFIKRIVWSFKAGCLYFDNISTKAKVYEILSYFVR